MATAHIALLSDDAASRRRLRSILAIQNYVTYDAPPNECSLPVGSLLPVEVVILDICACNGDLPDGIYSLRADSDASVIVLARSATETERVAALAAGADDFLTHPFSDSELLARIRAVLRRRRPLSLRWTILDLDGLRIDLATRRVVAGARQFHLTPKETGVLACLLENPNATVPHSRLLRAIWGQPCRDHEACLRVVVNQLRRKIERDPGHPRYLLTERWVGYRFEVPADSVAPSMNTF